MALTRRDPSKCVTNFVTACFDVFFDRITGDTVSESREILTFHFYYYGTEKPAVCAAGFECLKPEGPAPVSIA
jgi:hypothetical protein